MIKLDSGHVIFTPHKEAKQRAKYLATGQYVETDDPNVLVPSVPECTLRHTVNNCVPCGKAAEQPVCGNEACTKHFSHTLVPMVDCHGCRYAMPD